MKRQTLLAFSFLLSASLACAADVRVKRLDGGGSEGVGQGSGRDRGTVQSRPVGARDSAGGGRDHSFENRGDRNGRSFQGDRGAHTQSVQPRSSSVTVGAGHTRIVRQSQSPAPDSHGAIAGNRTIVRQIEHDRRVEIVPNHQYWHNDGNQRWVHTYRGGIHWYGFYHGRSFYWTRYYNDRWWWYDDGFDHWVFWANNRWWWNGPGGVLYVYENNSYYPYDEAPVAVPAPIALSVPAEEAENNGGEWTSRDGKRMVQIHGAQNEAFLYDKTGAQPQYLAYLGKNVERVRFSGGVDGRPVKILVDFKNGDFSFFTSEGEPIDVTPPETPSEDGAGEPPSPPTDIPKE